MSSRRKIKVVKRKAVIGLLVCIFVLIVSAGFAIAYLSATTDAVTNTFEEATASNPSVSETFSNNIKSDVRIDIGSPGYAVYVRAALVINWKESANGSVLGTAPELGTDYSLTLGDEWVKAEDGFYYYLSPISSGKTPALIVECKPLVDAPEEGCALNVEIIAQTVQAVGETDDGTALAVEDAWGIEIQ